MSEEGVCPRRNKESKLQGRLPREKIVFLRTWWFRQSRKNLQSTFEISEIKPNHHGHRPLLNQHQTALCIEALDDRKLVLRTLEPFRVILFIRVGIGQVDFCSRVVHKRGTSFAFQNILGRLRSKHKNTVLLTNRLELVERKLSRSRVGEILPELIHHNDGSSLVLHYLSFNQIKENFRNRAADILIFQKVRTVNSEVGKFVEIKRVDFIVKGPCKRPCLNPLRQAHRKRVLRVLNPVTRLKALRKHRQSPIFCGHGHDRLNCCCDPLLIQRSDLESVASDQPLCPSDQKLDVFCCRLQLEGIDAGRFPVFNCQISAAHRFNG